MGDMKCNSSPKVEVVSIAHAQFKIAGYSQVVDKRGGYHQIIYNYFFVINIFLFFIHNTTS